MMAATEGPNYPFPCRWVRERYPVDYLLGHVSEHDVQLVTLAKLRAYGIPALAVDAGARTLRGRAIGALKRAGADAQAVAFVNNGSTGAGLAGLADVVGALPGSGRALFLELKAPEWLDPSNRREGQFIVARKPGKPTLEQLGFLNTMHHAGALVGVIWHASELDMLLAPWKQAKGRR